MEGLSIDGNTLHIELSEMEAKIISRAHKLLAPLFRTYITAMCGMILAMVSLGKDKVRDMTERIQQGEYVPGIFEEAGIDVRSFINESVEWPSEEEVDEALGWLQE